MIGFMSQVNTEVIGRPVRDSIKRCDVLSESRFGKQISLVKVTFSGGEGIIIKVKYTYEHIFIRFKLCTAKKKHLARFGK